MSRSSQISPTHSGRGQDARSIDAFGADFCGGVDAVGLGRLGRLALTRPRPLEPKSQQREVWAGVKFAQPKSHP